MKNKVIKSIGAIFVGVLILTGCSQPDTTNIDELQAQLDKQVAINLELEAKVESLESELNTLKQEKEELISEVRDPDGAEIGLYTANVDTLAKEEIGKITVPVDQEEKIEDVEEVLAAMAEELSKQVFEGLPIEIEGIEDIDGKKIAVINLVENENLDIGWANNYLQGSTGAAITSLTLTETFLQKTYEGNWIDGIKILYQGEIPEFDHMPELGQVIYR